MIANEFAERLSLALEQAGIPADRHRRRKVALMFGVSVESVRKWLCGEAIPETSRLQQIALKTRVNIEWLLTGRGSMHMAAPIQEPHPSFLYQLTEDQRRAVEYSDNLTPSQRAEWFRWAEDQERKNREVIEHARLRELEKNS